MCGYKPNMIRTPQLCGCKPHLHRLSIGFVHSIKPPSSKVHEKSSSLRHPANVGAVCNRTCSVDVESCGVTESWLIEIVRLQTAPTSSIYTKNLHYLVTQVIDHFHRNASRLRLFERA